MNNVYEKLREHLDKMSTGFPSTAGGAEMKVLKRLFTEEDAELFLQMTPMLETSADAAKRLGREEGELAAKLEDMAGRGLLFRLRRPGSVKYSAIPFVIGIMEYQLKWMDRDMVKAVEDYYESGFIRTLKSTKTPLMRTVPINREVAARWPVAPYDDVIKAIDDQKTIMVTDCICRKGMKMIGKGCGMPVEACFLFGSQGDYYVDNGMGRYVSNDEAKAIVKKNLDEAPLVIQMANTQKGGGFCMCCSDCCGMLRSLKLQPKPAEAAGSNYRAVLDGDSCTGCGVCADRCQMEAIEMSDGIAVIDYNRCIGCGNCVTGCPSEAMKLEKKTENARYTPPENFMYTYMEIAKERGKM
jgi:formate hydrogenlyase subunit 6/NADH:ubiquinone oxidoreductase subunit I